MVIFLSYINFNRIKTSPCFASYLNIPRDNCRLVVKTGSPGNRNVQNTCCLQVPLGTCMGGRVLRSEGFHNSHPRTCQSSQRKAAEIVKCSFQSLQGNLYICLHN